MAIWQFVTDFNTATPTVVLDINSFTTGLQVGDSYNLDPPKFDKGYAGGVLRHGLRPTRSIAGNRNLLIPIQVSKADRDLAATAIELLGKQIATDNILKVQFGSTPVFFKTFADPDYAWDVKKTLTHESKITLTLEAEPFAYGVRVEASGSPFTVLNDPASGCFFDVASVQGDVQTPLLLHATSTGSTGAPSGLVNKWPHISTRRRGTPSGYSNVVQGESMTQGTGGVVTADAAMSGGSKSRIGFGTPAMTLRLSDTFPANGTATVEARGEYIVYARCAQTVAGDNITMQLGYGASSGNVVLNDVKTMPAATQPIWVELGKIPVPAWGGPQQIGVSGATAKVVMPFVGLYVSRVSGSGSLDVDCLYFMPADDLTLIAEFPATDTTYAIDGTTAEGGTCYALTSTLDEVTTTSAPVQIVGGGGFPEVIPGQTNRIHLLRHVEPTGTADALTNTTTIHAYYWPRWREAVRP